MQKKIRSLMNAIERDTGNEETFENLEELITGNEADTHQQEILEELEIGRKHLVKSGLFDAACQVLDLEIALCQDETIEASLYLIQAKILDEELFDQKNALVKYKNATKLREDDRTEQRIAKIQMERDNWQQLAETFVEQAEAATEPSLKAHLFYSAAERTYKNHKRGKDIPNLLSQALDTDPTHLKAFRLLERVLKERTRWVDLAEIYVKLAKHRPVIEERAQMLTEAAHLYAQNMEDNETAVGLYTEVLDYTPGNPDAIQYLIKVYEGREDWDHLVAVYENALAARLSPQQETEMLIQTAMTHWQKRGDMEAAERAFQRLRKLDPSHAGMVSFYRAHAEESGDNEKLLQVLADAKRTTDDPALTDQLTREVAQLAASDGRNIERAIDAWKSVLRKESGNPEATSELKRLYRQSQKWNALLDLLKGEAEAMPADDVAGKVAIFEEIVEIYRDKLALGTLVINTYKTILTIDPANVGAQTALSQTYEKEGRWNDLITLLTNRAAASEDPQKKIGFLIKVADLWIERFNNFNRAVGPLEEILSIEPTNRRAIDTLKDVYAKRRAWQSLLTLLEKETALLEGEEKKNRLQEMAELAAKRLSDHGRAIQLWKQVLEIDAESEKALRALESLTERSKDWRGLCEVIEMRIDQTTDDDERVSLLTKQGIVYKERLRDPGQSAIAWKRVLDIKPGHAKAMRSLKEAYLAAQNWDALEELYSGVGDYEGLVEVLGIAADRIAEPETKKKLSFRCAEIYEDAIDQPDRAVRHYERVLSVDPKNHQAARSLTPIYRRGEKWNRLLGTLEIVLEYTEETDERISLMDEIRRIALKKMNNRALAFDWAERAFIEKPNDESVRNTLENTAELADTFERLIALYKKHVDDFREDNRLEMMRHTARLSLDRLGHIDDAVNGYRAILNEVPGDSGALSALEDIFRANARFDDLVEIYDCRIELAEETGPKRDLLMELADLYEVGMDQPEKALERYKSVLALVPEDAAALHALERLLKMGERWSELTDILERCRTLEGIDTADWRRISFERAALFDEQLGDRPQSIKTYTEIFDKFPGDRDVIEVMERFLRFEDVRNDVARILEPHLVEAADWRRLAWVLEILIESNEDPLERLELQSRLAKVYANNLNDPRLAFETLGVALQEHPDRIELWDEMTGIAEELQIQSELADRFESAYASGKLDELTEVALANRLADLLDTQLGRTGDAAVYHQRGFKADAASHKSFLSLERWYTQQEQWHDLLALYKDALDRHSGVHSDLDLLLKICFIYEDVEQNIPAAIDAYCSVLALDADNQQAIRALISLYEEADRYEALSELLQSELNKAMAPDAISIRYRLGEIAEHHLNQPEEALAYYEQVLAEDKDHLKSQEALERLVKNETLRIKAARVLADTYDHQGAAEPLARVLMLIFEDPDLDTFEKVEILCRVADLKERRLQDPRGAFDALTQALVLHPANEDVDRELGRLAAENDFSGLYAGVLETVIPTVKEDEVLAARLISEAARLYDEQLGDLARAEVAYRKLLDLDPENPETALPAVRALERILTGGESWRQLLEVLRIKVRLIDDPFERKQILHRMAEIEESVLERIPNALTLFNEILELDDGDINALHGLERLYERERRFADLIGVLRQRAEIETDPGVRRDLLFRVARIFEEQLNDVTEAIAAYIRVTEEAGQDMAALDALTGLYEKTERYEELLETLSAKEQIVEDDNGRAALLFQMGDLLRTKLDDPEQAVSRLGEALALNIDCDEAQKSLEAMLHSPVRLEVIRILRPLYEQTANYERLLECDQIESEETEDPLERARIFRRSAEIAKTDLGQPERAFGLLGQAFRDGSADPDLKQIIDDLEGLAEQINAHDQLTALFREGTPDILDAALQIRCNLTVAEIAYREMKNFDLAREYYVKVLDIDGENAQAMDALELIYEESKRYIDLFDIYRRKAQLALDEKDRLPILFKQARVSEEYLEDISQAMSTYETILDLDPQSTEAISSLERLYPVAERWTDLMALLETRVSMEDSERIHILYRLGKLAQDKLEDNERAFGYYQHVLELDPDHRLTLDALEGAMEDELHRGRVAEILEPIYKASGDWLKLVSALEARIEFASDLGIRKDLLNSIGILYEEQLGNLEQAFETFSRLFREDIEDKTTWDVLTRLASVLEIWPTLAEVYATALDEVVGDTAKTGELAFILGDIYENRLRDPKAATAAYRRTLAFAPDDPKAFVAVERMLLATENWSDLLELYRDAADASMDMVKRKEYIYRIADIQEGPNQDLDAAIIAMCDVLDIDPADDRAVSTLNRLYRQAGRFEDLTQHIRVQISQAASAPNRNALRADLGQIYKEDLDDLDSAVDVYEEALQERAGGITQAISALEQLILNEDQRQRIADILEPLYRETDEWKKLVVILKTQVDYIEDPASKREKWKEIAGLHLSRGKNYLLAFEALSQAFTSDPTESETLSELKNLAQEIGNWDELAKVLNGVVENVFDLQFKMEILHVLGAAYDTHLDMPRKAISAYQSVLQINEQDTRALSALEALFNLVGDWQGLVDVLSIKSNYANTPGERAEVLRTKASIYEDLMASPADAIDAYQQALDAEPASLVTLDALERLYTNESEWHYLVEIKQRRLDVTTDLEEQVRIQREIAAVYEEQIDDTFEAINSWRAVLELDGKDGAAISALDRLYSRESMIIELLENLQLQQQLTSDQAMLVEVTHRIATLKEKQMSDLEGAIESYAAVLSLQPTHAGAIDALEHLAGDESIRAQAINVLEPLHREAGRWDHLAGTLELKLEIVDDPETRLAELITLAELHQGERSDPVAAFGVYARAFKTDPSRGDISEALERIAEAHGLWDRVTQIYSELADKAYDVNTEWTLLTRLGEIMETHRADARGAIDAYQRALDSGATDVKILVALDRLYEREGLWPELDEILEREIEFADNINEANRCKLRQGAIREREFGDLPGAVNAFKDVLESSPENEEASQALHALLKHDDLVDDIVEVLTPVYEARDAKDLLSELFENRLRVATTDSERVQLYRELAVHQEEGLQDLSTAFDAYAKAFEIDPAETPLLDELERLAGELGAWTALVDTVDGILGKDFVDPTAAVDMGLRVAKWAAENIGDPEKAEALYRSVLEKEPDHQEALSALETLLKSLGRFEALLPVMKQRADAMYDFAEKKAQFIAIAGIARTELADIDEAIASYEAIREFDDADVETLNALIDLYAEKRQYRTLVEILLARADYATDPAARNSYRHRAAEVTASALEDPSQAIHIYSDILDSDPMDTKAAKALEDLYKTLERFDDLKDLLLQQADVAETDQVRIDLYRRLAEISETRFEDMNEAIDYTNEILLINPEDTDAAKRIEQLYSNTERWQDLVDFLEDQADQARDGGDSDAELSLLTRMGEIWDSHLSDTQRATEIYERVLKRDPEHPRALAALARLYEAAADWERCAEALTKAAAAGRGGPEEAEVHYRLARLNETQLDNEDKAVAALQRAIELDPNHVEANRAMVALCRKRGDNTGLVAALMREEAHLDNSAEKIAKLLEIAEIFTDTLDDVNQAAATLERARTLAPDNTNVLLKLSDAYIAAKRQDDAIPVIESLIDAETNGGRKRSRNAAVYHHRLAQAYLSRGDEEKGIQHLESAYKMDISNLEVLVSLGKLHYERQNYEKAVKLFRALLLQRFDTVAGVTKADVYWYVGDISLKQGDLRKAKSMFQRGLDEDKTHEGCKLGLANCAS
ncbi:MAG: tetratricopeptide repeat protein [Myxococcota bacterium]|nr:tetratricopeptide repeat protein [Myxococcota bacterium]